MRASRFKYFSFANIVVLVEERTSGRGRSKERRDEGCGFRFRTGPRLSGASLLGSEKNEHGNSFQFIAWADGCIVRRHNLIKLSAGCGDTCKCEMEFTPSREKCKCEMSLSHGRLWTYQHVGYQTKPTAVLIIQ